MRIAIVQNHPAFGEKKSNVEALIKAVGSVKADLFILPELSYSGYQFLSREEAFNLSDDMKAPCLDALRNTAARNSAALVFGFPEKSKGKIYNSSLAVLPDGREYLYRKTHLFYKETLFFSPGDLGFTIFDYQDAKIGMAICFDWFFPESFRSLARQGAEIIAHCSNLVMPYCQRADFAQAVQNRVFIATANRIGVEARESETLRFTGGSVLVSPKGDYLLEGPPDAPAVLAAEIDPRLAKDKQLNPYNNTFKDRRPEFYL
ncbi:MAG: Nitrilase/cyanide hydratase and apolipoprotein N-acyltransferase [Spirochaetes bacterium]|nr:MAG: Nitrilase/cyanide hydratase and apolipoprotein N-acyltransferase [Spirochaetota bacterium]